jgi:peptide/nickel transport system permease protein
MGYVILKRIMIGIPTLIGVIVILFVTLRLLPGDPVSVILAGAPTTSPEAIEALRDQLGLNGTILDQFVKFAVAAASLNFGLSYTTMQPVTTMIAQQIVPTLTLALAAALVSAVVGISLGSLAAMYRDRWVDNLIRMLSLTSHSMPSFWLGLLLIMAFSFSLHIFPATGNEGIASLVLPAVALGLSTAGVITRLVRNSVIEVLTENFVVALYAKGLPRRAVITKHVLRNAIIPTVTILGLQFGALMAGAVVTETVFARQGIGQMLIQAINAKDYPVVQGVVFVIAVVYIMVNIVVDVSYAYIDPRIRHAIGGGNR